MLEMRRRGRPEDIHDVRYGTTLAEEQLSNIQELVSNYDDVLTNKPGCTNLAHHHINLSTREPIRTRPYQVPYALREELNDEIDEMMNLGIIRESKSPYASPVVMVKNKDGTNRVCIDYRKLNKGFKK